MIVPSKRHDATAPTFWIAYGPDILHGRIAPGATIASGKEVLEVFDDADAFAARRATIEADLPAALTAARRTPRTPLAILAHHRWQRETGGTQGPGGMALRTDERTRLAITSGISALAQEPEGTSVPWKLGDGRFVDLDLPALTAIQRAVSLHVQRCFAAEKSVADRIAAGEARDPRPAFEAIYADLAGAADDTG